MRFGAAMVGLVLAAALFAPWLSPHPQHADGFVDVRNAYRAPSGEHWLGTDAVGRDICSRLLFGYRTSLLLAIVVLLIAVPIGVTAGIAAAYFGGAFEKILMRIVDIFLAVPSLILAMAILGLFRPSLTMAMVAVSIGWWPWYSRLVYNLTRSIKTEAYVEAARAAGAGALRILTTQILPNLSGAILTKMTLDAGFVILLGASLSFLGLGAQPPTPDLGTMVAEGTAMLPDIWWPTVFSSLAIVFLVTGFNVLGDGLRDRYGKQLGG